MAIFNNGSEMLVVEGNLGDRSPKKRLVRVPSLRNIKQVAFRPITETEPARKEPEFPPGEAAPEAENSKTASPEPSITEPFAQPRSKTASPVLQRDKKPLSPSPVEPELVVLTQGKLAVDVIENIFQKAIQQLNTGASACSRTKTPLPAPDPAVVAAKQRLKTALQGLHDKTLTDLEAENLNEEQATVLANAAATLTQQINSSSHLKQALNDFQVKTAPYRTTWSWRVILGAVIGAVIGLMIGAMIGAAAGPAAAFTALACGVEGAIIGATLFGVGGALGCGGLGLWSTRCEDPLEETTAAAQHLQKVLK